METSKTLEHIFSVDGFNSEYTEEKAWGHKHNICFGNSFRVDLLFMKKNGYTSKHLHYRKKNRLLCLVGKLKIYIYTLNDLREISHKFSLIIGPGEKTRIFDIKSNTIHKLEALEESLVLELDLSKISEKDIHRFNKGGIKNDSN